MRRGRIFIYLALILILGIGAVALVLSRLTPPSSAVTPTPGEVAAPTQPANTIDVLMVKQRIARGEEFTSANIDGLVGAYSLPEELRLPDMLTDPKELIGRRARTDLEPQTLITKGMIIDTVEQLSTEGSDWAVLIPKGMVAVSIPIDRLSSVSFAPRRGDHVNVIASLLLVDLDAVYQSMLPNASALIVAPGPQGEPGKSPVTISMQITGGGAASALGRTEFDTVLEQNYYAVPSEPQRPRLVSQNVIQNVMVLQVGNFPTLEEEKAEPTPTAIPTTASVSQAPTSTPAPAVPAQGAPATGPVQPTITPTPPPPPDVITLVVSPQDAVTLNYLVQSGAMLTLALRSTEDKDTGSIEISPVTLQYLLDQYGIPVPVKLPYGTQPRIDVLSPKVLPNDVVATPVP